MNETRKNSKITYILQVCQTGNPSIEDSIYRLRYNGKNLLEYVIDNILTFAGKDEIIVFISKKNLNNLEIKNTLTGYDLPYAVIHGGMINAAIGEYFNQHQAGYVVRIIANNPFIDGKIIKHGILQLRQSGGKYLSFGGVPKGVAPSEIIAREAIVQYYRDKQFQHYLELNKDVFSFSFFKRNLRQDEKLDVAGEDERAQDLDVSIESEYDFGVLKEYLPGAVDFTKFREVSFAKITTAHIEPTNQCNLDCIMCARVTRKKNGTLAFDDYRKILENMPYLRRINFNGDGEPFLNRELPEFLSLARAKGIHNRTITNANVDLPNARTEKILANLDFFNISFDGATKETYETIRKNGCYAQAVRNIRQMMEIVEKNNFKFDGLWINFVIQQENIAEITQMVELAAAMRVPAVNFKLMNTNYDRGHFSDTRAERELKNRMQEGLYDDGQRIQAEIAHAFQLYMHDTVHAYEYFAPNIIGASSEGGAEFFNVDYFGYTATLAQSSQLYKQIMVGVTERVFGLMPFFRAEPSQTTRHLAEGKQFEFEMGFFDSWEEIMDIQEGCIKFIIGYIHRHSKAELAILGNQIIEAPEDVPIPRITFKKAQELYFARTGIDERKEPDLSPAAERELCAWAKEEHGTELIFITHWQADKRPFYAYPNEQNPDLTNTFDLLCAGTEITSGGQRRHTYESMVQGIREKEMNPADFADYLSIFKYGMPEHGGFGMGLERLTMTLLKLKNIREVSLFPSDTKRIAGNRIKARIFFGGENIRNEIIHQLKAKELEFTHLEHEPTPTAEDSSSIRKTKLSEGIKALILKGKTTKKNYQFNIPAHLKVDMKAVAGAVGEKCAFEDPAVILERFGLEIGSIPPFGNLLNIETYYDTKITDEQKSAFNC